jgi:mannan endo-1,4-beta-mannosidase
MMMKRRLAQKNAAFTLSCLATLNVFAKRFRAALLLVFFFLTPLPLCAQHVSSSLAIGSLIMSSTTGLIRPPKTLTDPNATSEAKSLMSFLVDHYGQQVLSGQQDMSEMNYVHSVTGKWPAVCVLDLIEYSPSRIAHGSNPTGTVESYISWANSNNGILSSSWHWNAPTDLIDEPNKEWWRGFYTIATTFDIQAVLADPCGTRYQLLISDMDAIALQLKKFQDANLPLLWRPLHEASGGWFWWGAKGSGPFIQLWQLMHDRFVNYHHLHNLIWVYTVGDPAWYPGDNYVDIVGMDIYPSDPNTSMVGYWLDTQSHFQGVKLVTLSESGIVPDPNKIRADKVWWSWFSVWTGDFIEDTNQTFLNTVYHDADIITLDELIDWKHYPVTGGAPIVSITQPAEGAEFAFGANIAISADASDPCGAVTKVDFYKNDVKLGEDSNAPYSFSWTNAPTGQYVLRAVATDNNGLRSDSQEVNIMVGYPLPTKIIRYEAESASRDINGPNFVATPSGYSGTGSMLFNGSGGTGINFTVTCRKAGNYPLTIRYLIPNGWGDKINTVLVNGSEVWSPNFLNTNSVWTDFDFGNISLNAGSNTVRIQHNWGWFYVDYIEIEFPRAGDFKDFVDFGKQWNHTNCGPANNWCSGFDFSQDGSVLIDDLKSFTESWLSGI